MASPTMADWERTEGGSFPIHDDEPGTDCEKCAGLLAELAKARQALRAIARIEPKPAKAELGDEPADCAVIGYAQAFAVVRARAELILKGRA